MNIDHGKLMARRRYLLVDEYYVDGHVQCKIKDLGLHLTRVANVHSHRGFRSVSVVGKQVKTLWTINHMVPLVKRFYFHR